MRIIAVRWSWYSCSAISSTINAAVLLFCSVLNGKAFNRNAAREHWTVSPGRANCSGFIQECHPRTQESLLIRHFQVLLFYYVSLLPFVGKQSKNKTFAKNVWRLLIGNVIIFIQRSVKILSQFWSE